ncbi:MAG TPA: phosphatase PAP2 family protein [Gemmatimonadales bacterium]|nr:phosphatase PAP2 family protein [Gemmatimonadales bacterium]
MRTEIDVVVRQRIAEIARRLSRILLRYSLAILLPGLAYLVVSTGLTRGPYLEYALLGSLAIYLTAGFKRRDVLLILGATLLYSLAAWADRTGHPLSIRSIGTLLGAGGLAAAGLRTAMVPVAEWRRSVGTASAAALFPALVFGSLVVRRELLGRTGDTYDLFAFALDQRYGVQLSFVLGRLFATWPSVGSFFGESYHVLPLLLGLLYGITRRDVGSEQAFRVALLLFVAGILGVAFYSMIPVCGPRFAFPDFPAETAPLYAGDLRLLALPTNIERNGVPSLHFAWALLVWWNLRRRSKAYRVLTGGFLAATVVATLGTGEHYLVDLVVAVPFALILQALFMARPPVTEERRWMTMAIGLGLTLAWVLALRSATFVSSAPLLAVAALTVLSVVLPISMERALWIHGPGSLAHHRSSVMRDSVPG